MKTWDEWMELHRQRVKNSSIKTKRTYVVLGCKRGGTSMLAGVLRLLGINMGDNINGNGNHEDQDMSDRNLEDMINMVQQKNLAYEVWGWKDPMAIDYIHYLMPFLINPVFLTIFRDPCAVANSEAVKHNKDFTPALWEAMEQLKKLHYFSMYPDKYIPDNNGQLYVLSYEKAMTDTEGTFRELSTALDLEFNPEILDFVSPEYKNLKETV